ncbi:MAG: hypothetical protein JWO32_2013 [Bacteroidetes bacterium]|nr:hypothetical protein [Bacteroidota bacterium]
MPDLIKVVLKDNCVAGKSITRLRFNTNELGNNGVALFYSWDLGTDLWVSKLYF